MAYTTAEARQDLLDALGAATDDIGVALAALGDAYEQLDDASADTLEAGLFGPVQHAYGLAKRTHSEFAARHDLPSRTFPSPAPGLPSRGVRAFVDQATAAIGRADAALATLQDSLMPVEVGDPELRAGLSDVRRRLGDVDAPARDFVRRLGR